MSRPIKITTQFLSPEEIRRRLGLSRKRAEEIQELMAGITAIGETRKSGGFVLPGVGRLAKSNRKARMGRNPAAGGAIKVPAKAVVKFRVAKAAKDTIAPGDRKK